MIFCEMFMSFSSTLIAMSIPGQILVLLQRNIYYNRAKYSQGYYNISRKRPTDRHRHTSRRTDGQTDGQTDGRTYLRYMLEKYPIIPKEPNNTVYFYGLNRIFNVCSFP